MYSFQGDEPYRYMLWAGYALNYKYSLLCLTILCLQESKSTFDSYNTFQHTTIDLVSCEAGSLNNAPGL